MQSTNKRILFLSIDGMTDALGQSQVLPYLFGLRKLGWEITIISAEKPAKMKTLGKKIKGLCDVAGIDWTPISYTSRLPVLSPAFNVWKLIQTASSLHKTKQFSIVHCRSYLPALAGLHMKRKFGTSFLFDIRGLWVDEKIDGNIWKLNNPVHRLLYSYFKSKEKELFKEADTIVSLTNKARAAIQSLAGGKTDSPEIKVIPCCVDTAHFDPNKDWSAVQESWRKRLHIQIDESLMIYLGSLSTWYLPRQMFGFYKTMEELVPGLRFLIVSGESPEPFHRMMQEEGIQESKVIFTSAQRDELPALISLTKFAVFFYQSSFSRQATSPTKLAELMSMGIPVVCSDNVGDVNEILKSTEAGTVCDPNNPVTWPHAAKQLIDLSKNRKKDEIRKWAIDLFDVQIGIKRYNEIYKNLSHQP
jgi:glycosyltransferase involved in cell wall biosynthesis